MSESFENWPELITEFRNALSMRQRVVRRFMEQIIILMRNVDACLSNIRYDQNSSDRIRYNHAAKRTNDKLYAPDLGKLVKGTYEF